MNFFAIRTDVCISVTNGLESPDNQSWADGRRKVLTAAGPTPTTSQTPPPPSLDRSDEKLHHFLITTPDYDSLRLLVHL